MTIRKWDAVIFDLDGTLADTMADIANAANAALKINGLKTHTAEQYRYMVGNGVRKLIERAAGGADPGVVERVLADYKRIYRESCLEFASVYDGMPKVINRLKSAGIPLFVVTNKPHEQALIIVEHLYGKGIFDGIYGGREGMKIKPDPTLTLGLLAQAGAKPGNSLFVGDSDVDIYTAANAGMKSAGVLWGFRGKDELLSAGADYLVKKPPQLLSVGNL